MLWDVLVVVIWSNYTKNSAGASLFWQEEYVVISWSWTYFSYRKDLEKNEPHLEPALPGSKAGYYFSLEMLI